MLSELRSKESHLISNNYVNSDSKENLFMLLLRNPFLMKAKEIFRRFLYQESSSSYSHHRKSKSAVVKTALQQSYGLLLT